MNINIDRLLRRRRTKDDAKLGSPQSAIPEHLLPILRHAAEDELERACDNGGEWNDEIRARVLQAARAAEVFDLQTLPPAELASLADRALRLPFKDPIPAPTDAEDLADFVALFGRCRDLIALRETAMDQAGRGGRA